MIIIIIVVTGSCIAIKRLINKAALNQLNGNTVNGISIPLNVSLLMLLSVP